MCRYLFLALVWLAGVSLGWAQTGWLPAKPGWNYQFPRDHRFHPDFKTEWWYFTGNLKTTEGRRFGYQLTFFRQGLRAPGTRRGTASRFLVDDLKFAHFAVSDPTGGTFQCFQKTSRGAFQEAGFADQDRLAWLENWSLQVQPDGRWRIEAQADDVALALDLRPTKPWTVHGENGISQKADGAGRASHYYSGTRWTSEGRLSLGSQAWPVAGTSWFDHEWASNQLTPEQVGWNWFSLHFEDGTELMLYQMRLRGGGIDPNSSGTYVAADGASQHLRRDDYQLTPLRWWTSPKSKGRYPVAWRVEVPRLGFQAEVSTPLEKQELDLAPVTYWEGMIDVRGRKNGEPIQGEGYLEMTGYSGPLVGLGG